MSRPHFFLWQSDKDGQWYWKLQAGNNETVAMSEGYTSYQAARKGIRAVRRIALLAGYREVIPK